jgi:CO/xanthine dehydrogenase FAD-binding subunit
MDRSPRDVNLTAVSEVVHLLSREEAARWRDVDASMAGGTWFYSERQPDLRRLVDLEKFGWEPLKISDRGLEIAATCTIARLDTLTAPADWTAAPLIHQCCSLLASFKIWNTATVGGNICRSLPAGSLISLTAALEGVYGIWLGQGGQQHVRA